MTMKRKKILRLFVEHVVDDVAGHDQLLVVVVVLRLATAPAALMLRVERANGAAQLAVASVVEHEQRPTVPRSVLVRIAGHCDYVVHRHVRQALPSQPTHTQTHARIQSNNNNTTTI